MSKTKLTPEERARMEKEIYDKFLEMHFGFDAKDIKPIDQRPSININLQSLIGKVVITAHPSPEGKDLPILRDSEIEQLESTVSEAVLKALGNALELISFDRQAEGQ